MKKQEYLILDKWALFGGGLTILFILGYSIWFAFQYPPYSFVAILSLPWLTFLLTYFFIIPLDKLGFLKFTGSVYFLRFFHDSAFIPLNIQINKHINNDEKTDKTKKAKCVRCP